MVSAAFLHTFHHQKVDYFVILMIWSQINLGEWVDLFIWGSEVLVLLKQGSYPFSNNKFKDFSRTHFPFFKDSIQCRKEP